jgi:hypothetical protein
VRVHDNDFQYVRRHGAMLTVERKAWLSLPRQPPLLSFKETLIET